MDCRRLGDDQLVERIETLSALSPDSDELWESLDEVFRRLRTEAKPEKRAYVEAVIARLAKNFSPRDDDEPGSAGVREPRCPAPTAGGTAIATRLPGRHHEAA